MDFKFAWDKKQNLENDLLFKFKISLPQEEATETESIDFVECYATRL